MRYDVKKFLFIGVEEDRDVFFKRAQDAGIIHFIESKTATVKAAPKEVLDLIKAIKVLRGLPVVEQEDSEEFDLAIGFAQKILGIKEKLISLAEEERVTKLEMARVEIFGAFSNEDIAYIENTTGRKVQFYCAKQGFGKGEVLPDELVYVDSSHGLDYFIAFNKQPIQYPKMIEMEIPRSWGDLKKRYHAIEKEVHVLESRLKGYSKYNKFLHNALVYQLNKYHLEEAKTFVSFPLENTGLFAVEGWVPEHKMQAMQKLVADMKVQADQIDINPNEVIPTYLENTGAAKIGEDLVHIYDTPAAHDKDPSLWVLIFFSLFFAMIIDDGGYGAILMLIALYFGYKNPNLKGVKKRFLTLVMILGTSCLIWGILTMSFFGIEVAPDSPLQKVSIMSWLVEKKAQYHIAHDDAVYQGWVKKYPDLQGVKNPTQFLMLASHKDEHGGVKYEAYETFSDNILMELALLVGITHIILSMLRNIREHWSYIGWIILIIGGYLYAPIFLNASSMANYVLGISREAAAKNGLYMIIGGFTIGVVCSAIKHKIIGVLESTVVIQIFGDILSYMRLYALGLAAAMLAVTVGELAASVPVFFGVIILIVGHTINLALGIMGGVIHGLRLNFLEWYHYSFSGGGRMFNPLRKQEIDNQSGE